MDIAKNIMCDYCGYLLPDHEERCIYNPVNLKTMNSLVQKFQETRLDILTSMDSVPCIISDFPTGETAQKCADISIEFAKGFYEWALNNKWIADFSNQCDTHIDELIKQYIENIKS